MVRPAAKPEAGLICVRVHQIAGGGPEAHAPIGPRRRAFVHLPGRSAGLTTLALISAHLLSVINMNRRLKIDNCGYRGVLSRPLRQLTPFATQAERNGISKLLDEKMFRCLSTLTSTPLILMPTGGWRLRSLSDMCRLWTTAKTRPTARTSR